MNKIFSVANQKGGVGKTTTAINIGAALGLASKKTLLIDFDPQGNASSGLGISEDNRDIYNVIVGDGTAHDNMVALEHNLTVIPASQNLVGAEIELVNTDRREYRLKEKLAEISGEFDYIIIDCPPSLSLLTVNALTASDAVIIPLQCEYFALEGIAKLVKTIELVKGTLNESLDIFGILLTMFDGRTTLSKDVVKEIVTHFPDKVFNVMIPRNVKISESPSYGQSVIHYERKSVGALSYLQLAQEILARNGDYASGQRAEGVR